MAEEITKLTQDEIVELIRRGDVNALREAIWERRIEVPQDLYNFQVGGSVVEGDSALHIAARFGQIEVLRYLATEDLKWEVDKEVPAGEEPQKETKTWNLYAGVKNINGETALDVAKGDTNFVSHSSEDGKIKRFLKKTVNVSANVTGAIADVVTVVPLAKKVVKGSYNDAQKIMISVLEAAASPVGPARDQNIKAARGINIPKELLPQKEEDLTVAKGNEKGYAGSTDAMGNMVDDAALYVAAREKITKQREALNKERDAREGVKNKLLLKAETGDLTEEDVQEYVATGGRIDCATDRSDKKGNAGKNLLHYAIQGGHYELFKMLAVDGVEVKSSGENAPSEVKRLNFDITASKLLSEALKKNPSSQEHQMMASLLKDPKTSIVIQEAEALKARTIGRGVTAY